MYLERVSFIDKIINFVASPFDKYISLDDRHNTILKILRKGEDIGKLSKDVKSDLLKSILWRTSIQNREIVSIQYNIPYKRLAEASKSGNFGV